jgi:protein SCO1/2
MKSRNFLLLGAGILVGLVVILFTQVFARPYSFQGSVINPPVPAPDFTLTDQNDQTFRLSDQRGEVVLLFFGYTHCPDECPATMAQFKQIQAHLGDNSNRVRFVFITVDPENDNPQAIAAFLGKFDSSFTGLTGSADQLMSVWKDYGVYQAKDSSTGLSPDLIEHSSYIYAIDMQGNLRLTYPLGTDAAAITADIAHLAGQ